MIAGEPDLFPVVVLVGLVVVEGDLQVVGSECPGAESAAKALTSMKSPRVGVVGIGSRAAARPEPARGWPRREVTVVKPSASGTLKHAWMPSGLRSSMALRELPSRFRSGQSRETCPFFPQPQHSRSAGLTGAAVHLPACILAQLGHLFGLLGPPGESLLEVPAVRRCDC